VSHEPILSTAEMPAGDLGSQGVYPRPAHAERAVESPPLGARCPACDRHHGSVGQERACLRREVFRLREELALLSEAVGYSSLVIRLAPAIVAEPCIATHALRRRGEEWEP
jgi:hypothetical protein